MTRSLLVAASISLFAISSPSTASATDLSDQISICKTEINKLADIAKLDAMEVDFRSNGSGTRTRKLSFMLRHDGDWGVARCTINGEDIRDLRWPRTFREDLQTAQAARIQLLAETTVTPLTAE